MVNIFIGLICVGVGSLYSFLGYALARILLPILGFFTGVALVLLTFGSGIFANIVGFALGLGIAWLAYFFLPARMIVVGVAISLSMFTTIMATLSFSREAIVAVVLGMAVLLGAVAMLSFLRKYVIITATALAGASIITTGILFLIPDLIPPGSISVGQVLIAHRQFPTIVFLLWIPLAVIGILGQYRHFKEAKELERDEA